ncbi:AcrR family transcriptional regulator [Sphingomonas endophytica]|uniref:AcrR family transcriptional regulator n=1 Tax=Sphingomonas endophytica TaxID=869719 RepID=A0A7X0JAF8_9SPHN|nr:TetR/AcrR family transcriptional regulator [Sphingomonas endophytica]MBB6503242.1 AcrR family transcriptional regulator [Sphingomonas endophytica]
MSPAPIATPRRRLSPEASRDAALEAARVLLVEQGPQAVTLKAVAGRIGRTHANLLHHFGSADGLQSALIERMTALVVAPIRDAARRSRERKDPAELVDVVFDAFGANGAGALATWMILNGNQDALDPILTAVHDLVEDLSREEQRPDAPIKDETLQLVLAALGDALLGGPMARALGLPRDRARAIARTMLLRDRGVVEN